MKKLKNCPWCNSEMTLYSLAPGRRIGIKHTEYDKHINCVISYHLPYLYKTKKLAIETWNRRVK